MISPRKKAISSNNRYSSLTLRTKSPEKIKPDNPGFPYSVHEDSPARSTCHNTSIQVRWQRFSGESSEFSRHGRQKSRAIPAKIRLFPLFWHITAVALNSGNRLSAVPKVIPASQVLSRTTTVGFSKGFHEEASSTQPLPSSDMSRNGNT
jgi:hypothetical protein